MADLNRRRSVEEWVDILVDNVSTVTQLDPEKGELPNVDDWRRCAEQLFRAILAQNEAPIGSRPGLRGRKT